MISSEVFAQQLSYPSSCAKPGTRKYFFYPVLCLIYRSVLFAPWEIARPLGLHYNHYVSASVRPLPVSDNVHNSWTIWYIYTNACQHSLTTGIRIHLFWCTWSLLSNCPACCGELVKLLITLEPYRIFGSNFAYLFYYYLTTGIQNGDKGLPIIILASWGILVKILITFEPHFIF